MKLIILIVLVIWNLSPITSPVWAQTMERNVEMQFDGDIEYVSESGGPAGQTVLRMDGNGCIAAEISTKTNGDSISYSVSGEGEGVTVTTGAKFYNGDIYLTELDGKTEWDHSYSGKINTFPTIIIGTKSAFAGSLKRIIDMENKEMWIDERFSVKGFGWVSDMLQFTPASEDTQ